VFCVRKIVRLSNCLQEQHVIFSLKRHVKHKYEVNKFNAISFLLNKLQILKLFTGTLIIILLKNKTIILHLKHVHFNAMTHKIQDRQKITIMSCNLKTTRYSPESYDCTLYRGFNFCMNTIIIVHLATLYS
jgi:hypothetical protein